MKYTTLVIICFLLACQNIEDDEVSNDTPPTPDRNIEWVPDHDANPSEIEKHPGNPPQVLPEPTIISHDTESQYPWTSDYDVNTALTNRFGLPDGYRRVKYDNFPFADWLRHLPLEEKGSAVRYYNGGIKPNDVHEAVLDIDIGKRDLQQCADAVMRLKAEYHYSLKDYSNIHFNFTSGDKVSFDDWRQGRKPRINGNKVTFSPKGTQTDNSYSNFKKYMNMIFNYAGTASLEKELQSAEISDIRPGDVFIQGGFPGHAVMVVDVAVNDQGKRIFMIAQSYMPAQSIHVLKNPNASGMSPWYSTDFGTTLRTPEWTFERKNLKRFRN